MWAVQHSPVSVEPQSTVQGVTSNSHGYLTTEMEPATGRSQLFSTLSLGCGHPIYTSEFIGMLHHFMTK